MGLIVPYLLFSEMWEVFLTHTQLVGNVGMLMITRIGGGGDKIRTRPGRQQF